MKSTESWTPATPDSAADRFEELRAAYHSRLRSDLSRLMAFRRQLDGPLFATLPYEDIRRAAHGMAGAAAMFDAGQIATAAAELEAAARDAHLVGGESGFLKVRVRLETLIRIVRETRG